MSRFSVTVLTLIALALLCSLGSFTVWARTPIVISSHTAEEAWLKIGEVFEKSYPEYEVQFRTRPGSALDDLLIQLVAGDPPDIMYVPAQSRLALAQADLLLDLAPYWERSNIAQNADLFPFVWENISQGGQIHGVPYDFSTTTLFLNLDALDSAGLPTPDSDWTVDDFGEYARRLTQWSGDRTFRYGAELPQWAGFNWQWARNFNGQGWLNDKRDKVLVEDSPYIDMLEFWIGLGNAGATRMPGDEAPAGGDQYTGGYGMWHGWTHWGVRIVDYDWTMANFPKGPVAGNHFAHVHIMAIPKDVPNPEKAWVFLEWLLSPEGQRVMVDIGVRQPLGPSPELWEVFMKTVPPAKQDLMYGHLMNTIYLAERVDIMQYWPTWNDVASIMSTHVNNVWSGAEDPRSAMIRAAEQIRALVSIEKHNR